VSTDCHVSVTTSHLFPPGLACCPCFCPSHQFTYRHCPTSIKPVSEPLISSAGMEGWSAVTKSSQSMAILWREYLTAMLSNSCSPWGGEWSWSSWGTSSPHTLPSPLSPSLPQSPLSWGNNGSHRPPHSHSSRNPWMVMREGVSTPML